MQRIGEVAYKLELPPTARIHPVFHVSQLKKVIGTHQANPTIPPELSSDLELLVEPEEVLGHRQTAKGREVLMKWKGLPVSEATWEDATAFTLRFPTFHLEDKVRFWEGGIAVQPIRPEVLHTYTRRGRGTAGVMGSKSENQQACAEGGEAGNHAGAEDNEMDVQGG